jgi:hypothetical protein
MPPVKFTVPVYNPCHQVLDVARDWNIDPACTTQDLSLVQQQCFRVAALRVFYNRADVYSYQPELANVDASQFDLVILSDAEYHQPRDIDAWIKQSGIKHYVLAFGGKFYNHDPDHSCELYRSYWLPKLLELNHYQPTDQVHKPYLFEALLGARRPNRDFFMLAAQHHDMLDQGIVTYREGFPGGFVDQHSDLISALYPRQSVLHPYISPNLDPAWEPRPNVTNTISFYAPYEIYQRTWYSILCETINIGWDFFFSEKIMKALYSQRIFLHFGAQYFLKNLHDLGFETFGDVIDESYDTTPNSTERFPQAFDQLLALRNQNHHALYQKLQPRLQHNHDHLMSLVQKSHQDMAALLRQHVPANLIQTPE